MQKKSPEICRHWQAVAEMGCIVTDSPATLHHCHGGSIVDVLGYSANPGMGQRQNHWLVIPLCPELHMWGDGIERDVRAWEKRWGTQINHLMVVSRTLGVNVFEKAGYEDVDIDAQGW